MNFAIAQGTRIGGRHIEVKQADPTMALAIPSRPRSYHRPAPTAPAASAATPRRAFVVEHVPGRRFTGNH
jgi:hypothetical protein